MPNKSKKKIHYYTKEQKLEWFGEGEWIEEADEIQFKHRDMKCCIKRHVSGVEDGYHLGGHLAGFVCIPENHPWHGSEVGDIKSNVWDGRFICINEIDENGDYWIGFCCNESGDMTPSDSLSRRKFRKLDAVMSLEKISDYIQKVDSVKNTVGIYRDVHYVKNECKRLVDTALTVFIKCTNCEKEVLEDMLPIHSYRQVTKWGTQTRAVCEKCHKETHSNWIENGWELIKIKLS